MGREIRKARVALVDDHPLFRQGLAVAIGNELDLEVTAEVGTASAAIAIAQTQTFDIAVVDILMPATSGITLAAELFEIQPSCRVIGLSVIESPGLIADMIRSHASGFACKTQPVAEVIDAIRQVLGGVRYLPPWVSSDEVERELASSTAQPFVRLTRREREVFELLIRGNSNDEIAMLLGISTRTVETHRQRITKKLSTHSIAEMQRISARFGGLPT